MSTRIHCYIYALNYQTKEIKEHEGYVWTEHRCPCGGCYGERAARTRPIKYYTNLADREGEVRGSTVWFLEPNPEKARKAFLKKANDMAEQYLDQQYRSLRRFAYAT